VVEGEFVAAEGLGCLAAGLGFVGAGFEGFWLNNFKLQLILF